MPGLEPLHLRARIDGEIVIFGLPGGPLERIRQTLQLPNPKYHQRRIFGGRTFGRGDVGNEPRFLDCAIEMPDGSLHLPRGCLAKGVSGNVVQSILDRDRITITFEDQRVVGLPLSRPPQADAVAYYDYQLEAIRALRRSPQGLIVLPPGTGKTRVAVGAVADQPCSTLVVVPTGDIADQWITAFATAGFEAGKLGDGKDERFFEIVVATEDSADLVLRTYPGWGLRWGRVIADECHRNASATAQRILRALPAKHRIGLSATPQRADGLTALIHWSFGATLIVRTPAEMIRLGYLQPARIELVETGWDWAGWTGPDNKRLAALERAVAEDAPRNALIARHVVQKAKKGESCLVLCRTRSHTKTLAELVSAQGVEARALTGKTAKRVRKADVRGLRDRTLQVVCATSLADEGLDIPCLSYIALASPQKARAATMQRLGRLLRLWEGKKPVLEDFVDSKVPTLQRRAKERERVYRDCELLEDAS